MLRVLLLCYSAAGRRDRERRVPGSSGAISFPAGNRNLAPTLPIPQQEPFGKELPPDLGQAASAAGQPALK